MTVRFFSPPAYCTLQSRGAGKRTRNTPQLSGVIRAIRGEIDFSIDGGREIVGTPYM
jgi:hypothetical protein